MFDRLLDDIEAGGTLEINSLAKKYDTTPQLITAMLSHLERLGVVASYVNCGDGCQSCSLDANCSHKAATNVWQSAGRA